jgi:hypothetical protein
MKYDGRFDLRRSADKLGISGRFSNFPRFHGFLRVPFSVVALVREADVAEAEGGRDGVDDHPLAVERHAPEVEEDRDELTMVGASLLIQLEMYPSVSRGLLNYPRVVLFGPGQYGMIIRLTVLLPAIVGEDGRSASEQRAE